jgi:excisionase family DNA binding protein
VSEHLPAEVLPDRLLDDAGAAELLNVPKSWVGEAARAGRLPHVKLGRYRRFDRAELLEWVEQQKAGGAVNVGRGRSRERVSVDRAEGASATQRSRQRVSAGVRWSPASR